MNDSLDSYTRHAAHFVRVYDLDDPSPYFAALGPSGYRMPAALAAALEAIHVPLGAVRGAGAGLRVLDFACGYGVIGALLRHDVSMAEIYAWYGERAWRPEEGRRYWEQDAAHFAARRREGAAFEIGGIDIAGNALDYAVALSFVDRAFHEDLVEDAPSDGLRAFLSGVDLVVESGALGVGAAGRVRAHSSIAPARRRPGSSTALDPTWTGPRSTRSGRSAATARKASAPGRCVTASRSTSRSGADMLRRSRGFGKGDEAILQRRLLSGGHDARAARGRGRQPANRRNS